MAANRTNRKLLICDDSIMDRMVLRNILEKNYEVIEAQNGYGALEILNNSLVDGLLLDISMPVLDGFGVLDQLDRSILARTPTLLISAEASKENIMKAAQYGVNGFIKKPFNATMILAKLKSIYDTSLDSAQTQTTASPAAGTNVITENELKATKQCVEQLKRVYLTYLQSEGKTDVLYRHVSEIMHILLSEYYMSKNPRDLSPEGIEIITMASYFYDIGRIVIRNEKQLKKISVGDVDSIPDTHTIAGADLISINNSSKCAFFVKIASDMCMHHHERCDGKGFPHGLMSSKNNIYTQMLSMAIEFTTDFFENGRLDKRAYDQASSTIFQDKGAYRPECTEILELSQDEIIKFYANNPMAKH